MKKAHLGSFLVRNSLSAHEFRKLCECLRLSRSRSLCRWFAVVATAALRVLNKKKGKKWGKTLKDIMQGCYFAPQIRIACIIFAMCPIMVVLSRPFRAVYSLMSLCSGFSPADFFKSMWISREERPCCGDSQKPLPRLTDLKYNNYPYIDYYSHSWSVPSIWCEARGGQAFCRKKLSLVLSWS